MTDIFIAGEGRNELGSWYDSPESRHQKPMKGVIEALLEKVSASGWQIQDGITWKSIRKLRSGQHRDAEMRNVLGAALKAKESHCHLFVFVRDRDADPQRQTSIEQAIQECPEHFPGLGVVGGIAQESIESWILSLKGQTKAEKRKDPAKTMNEAGIASPKCTEDYVRVIEEADMERIPQDAKSLRLWLERASIGLNAKDDQENHKLR
jgi:hypothetical protein